MTVLRPIQWQGQTLFRHDELACPLTGRVVLAPGFDVELRELRLEFDRPMRIARGACCRSAAYNARIGGHARSLHVYDEPHHPTGGTAAIDVSSRDVTYNAALTRLALDRGWSVGVARWGIHLDRRAIAGLDQAVFGYGG